MASLFLDASGWFAAMSPRERDHDVAARTYGDAARRGVRLVTTNLVIAEVHALVLRWRDAKAGRQFLDLAGDTDTHAVTFADAELTGAAITRWIRGYADQRFSFADAVSFEVMRRERLLKALTFDDHFRVAGFETL